MQIITLKNIPRQRFNVVLEGSSFDISLYAVGDCMYADISKDGSVVVAGVRCMPNFRLIPYRYLEGKAGNFVFQTDGSYPWYENFSVDQQLYYVTATEAAEARS